MRRRAAIALCALVLGASGSAAARLCEVPGVDVMAERYRRAIAVMPDAVAARMPDLHVTADWRARPGAVVLTNGAGTRAAFSLADGGRTELEPAASAESGDVGRVLSPDGTAAVVRAGDDLALIDAAGRTRRLTQDGAPDLAYGATVDTGSRWLRMRKQGKTPAPYGVWSPDGRWFATLRVDQRGLRTWPMVIAGPEQAGHRLPVVEQSRIALPGDAKVPTGKLVLIEVATGRIIEPDVPPLLLAYTAAPIGGIRWADGETLFMGSEPRNYRRLDIWRVDATRGTARIVLTEQGAPTPIRPLGDATAFLPIRTGADLIVFSERDGRGHLYLHDGVTGRLKRRLTGGDWSVAHGGDGVLAADEAGGFVYFTAYGREPGEDPYYRHFYRVPIAGGDIARLTPENGFHEIDLRLAEKVFLDRASTPADPPVMRLRALDGRLIAEVIRVDAAPLRELGWVPPERFKVLAADGRTELWGTLHKPPVIEGARCHPIVDSIYAGPQTVTAQARFLDDWPLANATAQLGLVVFELDGRGTPLRDRAFRDATWGPAFGGTTVADDHAAAIRQLAERHVFIDPERAGIYGHSWGGYYTVRAMAQRPDVFKVGVATAGSHDNYLYAYEHDRWFGRPDEFPDTYRLQSNLPLAPKVTGRLLLAHGSDDDDVHPINTLLMAGALAKANRPFDMLMLPDLDHDTLTGDGYFIRRRWDFLIAHLLEARPPERVAVPDRAAD